MMKPRTLLRILHPSLLALLSSNVLLSACDSRVPPGPVSQVQTQVAQRTPTPVSHSNTIQINGAGATFPLPIYAEWTYAYSFVDPAVEINYEGIGSGGGKKAIIAHAVDFAGSDSLLSEAEYAAGEDLQMYPILAGAVVIIYNFTPARDYPDEFETPALVLDRQTLVDIYNGTVNRWNDPRIIALNPRLASYLPEAPLTVVHRSDASGTTELFTKSLVSFSSDWTDGSAASVEWPVDSAGNGIGAKGNQDVAEAVVNTGNSLGYVELSYALSNNLIYADMINRAGRRVSANAESLAAAIHEFDAGTLDDRLTATLVDGRGEGSWPIAGFTYLILHTTSMADCERARKLLEYIQWTLTDISAGRRAAQLGYAVVPDAVQEEVIRKLGDVTCYGRRVME
jgi:phosphate transport system substrate-binding protein